MTAKPISSVVIVHFDENGEINYRVAGDETVRLFIVDERAPHDRVYEWTKRCDAAEIRRIIPAGSDIGSSQDDRHEAIAHVLTAMLNGERRLRVVEDGDE